jgi:hypothetical protein
MGHAAPGSKVGDCSLSKEVRVSDARRIVIAAAIVVLASFASVSVSHAQQDPPADCIVWCSNVQSEATCEYKNVLPPTCHNIGDTYSTEPAWGYDHEGSDSHTIWSGVWWGFGGCSSSHPLCVQNPNPPDTLQQIVNANGFRSFRLYMAWAIQADIEFNEDRSAIQIIGRCPVTGAEVVMAHLPVATETAREWRAIVEPPASFRLAQFVERPKRLDAVTS